MDLPDTTTPEQLDKIMPALLRSLLSSGDKGYKDAIDRLDPEPSQSNNWCFDNDLEHYQGVLVSDGKRVSYLIKQERGQWTVTTRLESSGEFAEAIDLSGDTTLLDDAEWDALADALLDEDQRAAIVQDALEQIE